MMRANSLVVITGLVARSDLNGKEGVAERLLISGRYVVHVGEERVKIKFSNLFVKDHTESLEGDSLLVNGLSYCAPHRLECCGACRLHFRLANRVAAMSPPNTTEKEFEVIFALAETMDKDEEAQNLPPFRAPIAGKHGEQEPLNRRLNKNELISDGLNPETLTPWLVSVDGKFSDGYQSVFTMQETLMRRAVGGADAPSEFQAPLYFLRKMLLDVAAVCDKKAANPTYLLPRFVVQDAAESEGIMWDVLGLFKVEAATTAGNHSLSDSKPSPLLTVRWVYNTAASLQKMLSSVHSSLGLCTEGTKFCGFTLPVEDIRVFKRLLEADGLRLDPSFALRAGTGLPDGWLVSTIRPVSTEALKPARAAPVCAACGKEKPRHFCSRCKEARYCDRECQVAHWGEHKRSGACRDLDAAAVGQSGQDLAGPAAQAAAPGGSGQSGPKAKSPRLVSVDLTCPEPLAFAGMRASTISHTKSSSKSFQDKTGSSPATSHRDDKMFVIKVQLPMAPVTTPESMGFGMMVYDERRKLNASITSANCAEADWRALDSAIRRGGISGGLKGYFKAFLSKGSMKVLVDEPLPLQPW